MFPFNTNKWTHMQKTIYLLLVLFAISCINPSRNQAKSIRIRSYDFHNHK